MLGHSSPEEGFDFLYLMAIELLRTSQLYVELDGQTYGEPAADEVTSKWITGSGKIITHRLAPELTDNLAIAAMKHFSFFAVILHAVLISMVEGMRATGRGVWYLKGESDMPVPDVYDYMGRLSALASHETKRLVSRWEVGLTAESDLLMWTTTLQIDLEGGGRTGLLSPAGSRIPHPREWKRIKTVNEDLRWILITEKGCLSHPLAMGRRSLLRSYPGGVILDTRGALSHHDRASIAALACSYPKAQIFGFFDPDISGAKAYMSLKVGAKRNLQDELPLSLGNRLRNLTPIPQPGCGRVLTSSERTTLEEYRKQIPQDDPDYAHFSAWLDAGRSSTVQEHDYDEVSWVSAVLPDLEAEISEATVNSHYVHVLPGNDERDHHFPKLEDIEVIIRDLAAVRDFWHQARMDAEREPGKRPTALKKVARWRAHKRRHSEVD